MPPSLRTTEWDDDDEEVLDALPAMTAWVRGSLVGVALGLAAVFVIALSLDPYRNGQVQRHATHTQLGLPPCTFYVVTGRPCPSCGFTTSFALLMRGDVGNSVRANWVGTLLALTWLGLIPWCLASAWRSQPLFVRSVERTLSYLVIGLIWLMLARWALVLALAWWNGTA